MCVCVCVCVCLCVCGKKGNVPWLESVIHK